MAVNALLSHVYIRIFVLRASCFCIGVDHTCPPPPPPHTHFIHPSCCILFVCLQQMIDAHASHIVSKAELEPCGFQTRLMSRYSEQLAVGFCHFLSELFLVAMLCMVADDCIVLPSLVALKSGNLFFLS